MGFSTALFFRRNEARIILKDRLGIRRKYREVVLEGHQAQIKVVRIIARLNIGGPAKQAIILTEKLNDPRFISYLITGTVSPEEANIGLPQSLKNGLLTFPELGREVSLTNDCIAFWKLFKILKQLKPDIVHTHTAKAGGLGRLAAVMAKVPIRVHTFHGHVFKGYFGLIKTQVFILLERWLARFTDCIVVLSTGQLQELSSQYKIAPKRKFTTIPLGFDLDPFVSQGNKGIKHPSMTVAQSSYLIGFVGRLVPIKNPSLLLQGIREIETFEDCHDVDNWKVPKYSLHLVGGGPLYESLKQEVQESKLRTHVVFEGWQAEMQKIYSAMDVVVLTSINEGTPVVLIEAMASGKPFVATNVGGVRDLMIGTGKTMIGAIDGKFRIYENGILVESQDLAGLAGALLYLMMNQQEGRQMGNLGQEFALKRFGKNRLLRDIKHLYEDLVQEKKAEI